MIPLALKPNAFAENIMAIRARVIIMNDMIWLKNVRYGAIENDAFYIANFVPALFEMQAMEARGECPDLGPAIIETVKRLKNPAVDVAPLADPDWRIERAAP